MSPCFLVDTHCHLNMPPLGDDPDAVLRRADDSGVTRVIVPAYDRESWSAVVALSGQQNVFAGVGLHPWVADQTGSPGGTAENLGNPGARSDPLGGLIDKIRSLATDHPGQVVAIGEIGLDTKVETPGLDVQLPVLEAQLQLAVDLDLPVMLHCRGANDELLAAVDNHGGQLRGVVHGYSQSRQLAERFLRAGLHIGLGGVVTRPAARRVRQAAAVLPLDKIVLETDAPSIGLDQVPGIEAEPRHVRNVAEALSALRGLSVEEVAAATTGNARSLFRIS